MSNIKLNKNSNHFFKVLVNHGNSLLNDEHVFVTVAELKDYLRGMEYSMLKVREIMIKQDGETIRENYPASLANTKTKWTL